MEDLSLHILDIVENSLRAGAENVDITLTEDKNNHLLQLEIKDDGVGMDEDKMKHAMDPFYSTKTGKKFGLGLALLRQACEEAGGNMEITSRKNGGVKILACFDMQNIDIKPVGRIDKTLRVLRATHPDVNFSYKFVSTKNRNGRVNLA
jgi:signal transduction histidine kinase